MTRIIVEDDEEDYVVVLLMMNGKHRPLLGPDNLVYIFDTKESACERAKQMRISPPVKGCYNVEAWSVKDYLEADLNPTVN